MGNYTSRGYYRHEISKEEYNLMLPIYGYTAIVANFPNAVKTGAIVVERDNRYFFIGSKFDFKDMKERCKYL